MCCRTHVSNDVYAQAKIEPVCLSVQGFLKRGPYYVYFSSTAMVVKLVIY